MGDMTDDLEVREGLLPVLSVSCGICTRACEARVWAEQLYGAGGLGAAGAAEPPRGAATNITYTAVAGLAYRVSDPTPEVTYMRPIKLLLLLAAALTLVTACSTSAARPSASPASPAASESSGSDTLAFNSRTLAGADFTGQSLSNKPAVLWFWAPWCSTCQAEAPTIAQAAAQHPNVTFIGVAALDQVPAMNQFVANYQLGGFTHLADMNTSVWRHFGVTEQPALAFIAPSGAVQVVKGTMSEPDLAQRLDALPRA